MAKKSGPFLNEMIGTTYTYSLTIPSHNLHSCRSQPIWSRPDLLLDQERQLYKIVTKVYCVVLLCIVLSRVSIRVAQHSSVLFFLEIAYVWRNTMTANVVFPSMSDGERGSVVIEAMDEQPLTSYSREVVKSSKFIPKNHPDFSVVGGQ